MNESEKKFLSELTDYISILSPINVEHTQGEILEILSQYQVKERQ